MALGFCRECGDGGKQEFQVELVREVQQLTESGGGQVGKWEGVEVEALRMQILLLREEATRHREIQEAQQHEIEVLKGQQQQQIAALQVQQQQHIEALEHRQELRDSEFAERDRELSTTKMQLIATNESLVDHQEETEWNRAELSRCLQTLSDSRKREDHSAGEVANERSKCQAAEATAALVSSRLEEQEREVSHLQVSLSEQKAANESLSTANDDLAARLSESEGGRLALEAQVWVLEARGGQDELELAKLRAEVKRCHGGEEEVERLKSVTETQASLLGTCREHLTQVTSAVAQEKAAAREARERMLEAQHRVSALEHELESEKHQRELQAAELRRILADRNRLQATNLRHEQQQRDLTQQVSSLSEALQAAAAAAASPSATLAVSEK